MLLDEAPKETIAVLSWNDQIKKGESKIIEPKGPAPREEKVLSSSFNYGRVDLKSTTLGDCCGFNFFY
jgi:hypothetical protein